MANRLILAAFSVLALTCSASAVVLNGVTPRNTSAPVNPDHLALWNLQGTVGGFLATPIGPRAFIGAAHAIGGTPSITLPDGTRASSGSVTIPGTDLRVFTLAPSEPSFVSWAPLWNASIDGPETGRPAVVFGRGTQRGDPVYLPPAGPTQIGWAWGASDNVRSWGVDTIEAISTTDGLNNDLLAIDFKSTGSNELALSGGDSSGAMFVQAIGGAWKLGGINYAVDLFSYTGGTNPPTLQAFVYDARGMYYPQTPSPAIYIDPIAYPDPVPMWSYGSRIAYSYDSLVTFVPEPTTLATCAGVALIALRRR
jgi:hypothetical protein